MCRRRFGLLNANSNAQNHREAFAGADKSLWTWTAFHPPLPPSCQQARTAYMEDVVLLKITVFLSVRIFMSLGFNKKFLNSLKKLDLEASQGKKRLRLWGSGVVHRTAELIEHKCIYRIYIYIYFEVWYCLI